MPSYNITSQDFSPMIIYSGDWQAFGNNDSDDVPVVANYSGSSFTNTSSSGASLSLSFWGTGVYLEGAKRTVYGSFNATLDGQTTVVNASRSQDIFQTALFSAANLTSGQHTFTVNCTGEAFDVDFIKFTAGDGVESTTNDDTTLDDGDSSITYLPSDSEWHTSVTHQSDFFDQTAHQTQSSDAAFQVTFSGNAIEVYGSLDRGHGLYSTRIDSEDPIILNGSSTQYHQPSVPIFVAGGLAFGAHTLSLSNSGGATFDLDQVIYSTWPSFSTSSGGSASSSTNDTASSGSSHSRIGIILGCIVGVFGCLALVALAIVCLRRRRKVKSSARKESFSIAARGQEARGLINGAIVSPYITMNDKSTHQRSTSEGIISRGPEQRLSTVAAKSLPEPVELTSLSFSRSSAYNASVAGSHSQDIIHETDAGPAPDQDYNVPMWLPPAYDQVTGRT